MKTKNIKVQYSSRYQSGFAPKIQMEGRWLEKLGFPIGTHLVVEYEEGSIRIRPFTEEETAAIVSPSKLKFLSPAQKHRIKISSP